MTTGSPAIKWIAFMAAGVFIGSVAVLLGVEQMFFMAACLFLTPLVSIAIGRYLMLGLTSARRAPGTVDEGEDVDVEVTLANTGRFPKFFMTVSDKLPIWLTHVENSGNVILQLDPGEERAIHYRLRARKRGVYSVGPTIVAANDPFGFFSFKSSIAGASELVVFPAPLPLSTSLVQPGAYGWRGDADGLRRGSGADFHGVREYQHGDELRRVHWRTTARTGKLAVAEYTQGETLDMLIALDLNQAAHADTVEDIESPVEYAVKIAATIAEDLTRNGHVVRLLTTSRKPDDPIPTNAGKWSTPLLEALARAETTSKSTLAQALSEHGSQLERGVMIIYLTPDGADPRLGPALAHCEDLGAVTAGFVFDKSTFPSKARQAMPLKTAQAAVDALGHHVSGPVRLVRAGDDVVEAIHDLLTRHRGARIRRQSPIGMGERRTMAVDPKPADKKSSVSALPNEERAAPQAGVGVSIGEGDDDVPSLPLYLAGLIVTLCGILSVTEQVGDPNLTGTTVLLTLIGFVFSIGCRYLKVHLHIAELLLFGTAAYVVYGVFTGGLGWRLLASHTQDDIGVVFAWAMTAWSWALISDGLVLMCALLSMASIGLMASAHIDDAQIEICFVGFIVSSLFLMGQHLYRVKRAGAPAEERDGGGSRFIVTQAFVVGGSALLIFLAASVLVVPAQMVFRGASLLQAIQGLASLSQQNKTNAQTSGPAVSDDADFEIGTGEGFGSSSDVVAYAQPSDRQPHYWKARTYDEYTGVGWTSSQDGQFDYIPGNQQPGGKTSFNVPAGSADGSADATVPELTTSFDVQGYTREFFYTGELRNLTVDRIAAQLEYCADGHATLGDHSVVRFSYQVADPVQPDPESPDWASKLRHCGSSVPFAVKLRYTNLENQITTDGDIEYFKRTVDHVVAALPAARRDEYDVVEALKFYVSRQAVYNLDVPPLPAETDHVRTFLQDTRVGYCDMFASSLAVLCRAAGYPSRVVTGFAPGSFDGTRYTLRALDKHAWTEVYFPGYGWVTVDATPDTSTVPTHHAAQSSNTSLWDRLRTYLTQRGPVAPILLAAIFGILLYIVKVEVIDRLRTPAAPSTGPVSREEVGKQYERMVKSIGRLGLRRRPSETPHEFGMRAVPYLKELEAALSTPLHAEAIDDFTRYYQVVRYAGPGNRRRITSDVEPELTAFLRGARRARIKRALRRLARRPLPTSIERHGDVVERS